MWTYRLFFTLFIWLFWMVLVACALLLGHSLTNDNLTFLSDQDGEFKIYVMDIERDLIQKLNNQVMPSWHYSISPDGKWIAYTQTVDNRTQFFVSDITGNQNQRLVEEFSTSPIWSPDGEDIAFMMVQDDVAQIYSINISTRKLQQLTRASHNEKHFRPAWSPSGESIAYTSGENIYVASIDGNSLYTLPSPEHIGVDKFTWSPDGSQIAFLLLIQEKQHIKNVLCIAEININKTNCFWDEINGDTLGLPVWSPDGDYIAYTVVFGEAIVIDILSVKTGETRRVIRQSSSPSVSSSTGIGDPLWTPNGTQLVFEVTSSGGRDRGAQIYIINVDGSNLQRLTDGKSTNIVPSWSPTLNF